MRPLLSLVAILKDEEKSIQALLDSVKGVVDHFTILDTGSADRTLRILSGYVTEYFEGRAINKLRSEPVVPYAGIKDRKVIDYAATRNRALELEQERPDSAVFTLFLSGDETLQNGEELRAYLETKRDSAEGGFCVAINSSTKTWPYVRVLRTDANWRYRFPIHEVPFGPAGETTTEVVPNASIRYAGGDKGRYYKRLREVDLPVLTHLASLPLNTHEDHVSHARAIAFLAQTHEQIATAYPKDPSGPWLTHVMAAMSYHWRRAELGGDPVDTNHALFHFLNLAESAEFYDDEELLMRLDKLIAIDPDRPEIRFMAASHQMAIDSAKQPPDFRKSTHFALEAVRVAREAKEKPLLLPTDSRMEWLSLKLLAECYKQANKADRAKEMAEKGMSVGGPREAFEAYL